MRWIQSYLENRQCYVQIGPFKSKTNTFNIGVPQGSILGPTLFLIYVNNLPKFSDILMTQLFADDTIVSNAGPDINTLIGTTNAELYKLKDWTQANKLTIHAGKSKLLVVSNKRIPEPENLNITLLDTIISPSNHCKYLGIYLDDKMTFNVHIQHVCSKISRYTGILYKIRDNLPIKTRLHFYYAYIYPYLSYNTMIWGGAYDTHLQPLLLQQKRTIRTIASAGFRDHTNPLFKQYQLLKIHDIYNFQLGTYMFKARARGDYTMQTRYSTRRPNNARSTFHRLSSTQHAVSYAGPTFWNSLPPNLKSINSLNAFRKALKQFLLDKYNDNE